MLLASQVCIAEDINNNVDIVKNPFDLFKIWLKMAEDDNQIDEPNAFTLGTVNQKNEPRNRVVLMK